MACSAWRFRARGHSIFRRFRRPEHETRRHLFPRTKIENKRFDALNCRREAQDKAPRAPLRNRVARTITHLICAQWPHWMQTMLT